MSYTMPSTGWTALVAQEAKIALGLPLGLPMSLPTTLILKNRSNALCDLMFLMSRSMLCSNAACVKDKGAQ